MAKSKKRSEPAAKPSAATSDEVSSAADTRDRIAIRAYELYLARGGSHGSAFDDWIEAERELNGPNPQTQTESDRSK